MNALLNKPNCSKCRSFRELSLHLHELFMFCDLLNNDHSVFQSKKKVRTEVGRARTANIAKWLRLASQITSVKMNTFRYQESHQMCRPVADELYSNADHYSSIITPLTRFIFIANALEETYRFTSTVYELKFDSLKIQKPSAERLLNHSMQASWLLEELISDADVPVHYDHKVDVVLALARRYQSSFNVRFDTNLESRGNISYGLSLVRDLRNQIAHAEFPIIDDPEYTGELFEPNNRRLILSLLHQASRVAAMNIQMLLRITNDRFNSDDYHYLCNDPDYGDRLESLCTLDYLTSLHIDQTFGLNESDLWRLRSMWDDSSLEE